ncbi:MAG TPA: NADPH-dependent FMN reductase [Gemmatimonadaceae bacterium]|jgi:chromate reductase|nr:NADPH-dependent FMN reductase [Gemmatimonadaceae bacterium]
MSRTIGILVGSLRTESYTRKIANAIVTLFPPSMQPQFIDIGQLPLYNADLETESPPAAWVAFREQIRAADAFLFATPEYNRSVPGVLKNALDVASRPSGHSGMTGKPAAVVSVSTGSIGAFGANHHLRQSLVYLDMPTMLQPEAYIGGVAKLLGPDGTLTQDSTREFLRKFVQTFDAWIERTIRR